MCLFSFQSILYIPSWGLYLKIESHHINPQPHLKKKQNKKNKFAYGASRLENIN